MVSENRIRVVTSKVGEEPAIEEIANSLGDFKKAVGGYIEVLMLSETIALVLNEEGKLEGLEPNFKLSDDFIVGDVVFCGINTRTRDFTSLTVEEQGRVLRFIEGNQI